MTIQRTETNDYYFVRKPHGIPTTFGSQFSFLEKIVHDKPLFFQVLAGQFTQEEEYGLLNRLDNDTAGYLYFAKTPAVKVVYKKLQDEQKISKLYIAHLQGRVDIKRTAEKHPELLITNYGLGKDYVEGDSMDYALGVIHLSQDEKNAIIQFCKEGSEGLTINYPIMHHTHDDVRMVAIRMPKDEHKGRGEKHYVNTTIYPIAYNDTQNTTLCLVEIYQGIRHQIRIHVSSIGYPVVGDMLYGKQVDGELHLRSVGIV